MPKVPDKILLNCATTTGAKAGIDGRFDEIHALLEAAESFGKEIIANGWLDAPGQADFLKRKIADCADLGKAVLLFKAAQDQYIQHLQKWLDDLRIWIDQQNATP